MVKSYGHQARFIVEKIAFSFLHKPYIFGGKGSQGIDCSGLIVECLKSIGAMDLHGDMTADGLWKNYKKDFAVDKPCSGCFAFWRDDRSGKMYHCAICISETYCITADGGGKNTKTVQDAMTAQARVKIRRIDHRLKNPKGYLNLFP